MKGAAVEALAGLAQIEMTPHQIARALRLVAAERDGRTSG
jgi:hypothetical protein